MANFIPLKNYMFFCLDRMIGEFDIKPPFLDAGCGVGDVSHFLARKGWNGKAIDTSAVSIERAKNILAPFHNVTVEQESVSDENGAFNSIFLWDVLEHIEDDRATLNKLSSLLLPNGHLVVAVPSNPREWRWDDDFYGHIRRYSQKEITEKISHAGMEVVACMDFTYPLFWALRRMYTFLKRRPAMSEDKEMNTMTSATKNAWEIPFISKKLNSASGAWRHVYMWQFSRFRNKVANGHEMFVVALKKRAS